MAGEHGYCIVRAESYSSDLRAWLYGLAHESLTFGMRRSVSVCRVTQADGPRTPPTDNSDTFYINAEFRYGKGKTIDRKVFFVL